MRTGMCAAPAVFLLTLTAACVTNAAEWKIDPRIKLRAGYNDNITLRVDDEVSSPEIDLAPSARFSYETPRSGISGDLGFEVRRYPDESDLNDEIGRLDLSSFYQMERSQLGFNVDLTKDTTLDSQLEATGVVLKRVDRRRASLNPTWRYSLNERTSTELGYTYTTVDYDDDEDSGFVDYDVNLGELSLTRLMSERLKGTLMAYYGQTENDAKVKSTYAAVQGGFEYRFSETVSGSLFGGIRRTESEATRNTFVPIIDDENNLIFIPVSSGTKEDDYGYLFSASVQKDFLRGTMQFSATRDVTPQVSGFLLQVTRLRWNNLYRFSEILSGELNMSYYQSEGAGDAGIARDRNYYQIEPRFNWRFREFWVLSGSYRYREQTIDNVNDDAVQNAAYLTLRYDWPRIAISR
jgi:hypothetical protein